MTDQFANEKAKGTLMTRLEWGVIFSILISAGSIIFSGGVIWTTVQVHDRDIAVLKAKGDATTDRLARMETKIDLLLDRERVQ